MKREPAKPNLDDPFEAWVEALYTRHLKGLTHAEVSRALKALTQDYVQRRHRLHGKALDGRGKQAAFALYYGPRHFVVVREVLRALGPSALDFGKAKLPTIVDLGCGTGVGGAAWAMEAQAAGVRASVIGVDLQPELLVEAVRTWRELGLRGGTLKCHLDQYRWPPPPVAVLAAFTLNELDDPDRERLWAHLTRQAEGGSHVLILEPLATGITPWWQEWARRVTDAGGRADEWHLETKLAERVRTMGKSAGLRPEKLGARTLYWGGTGT